MALRWIGIFGSLCLCSILSVDLRAQDRPKAAPVEKIPKKNEALPEWTIALKRQLEKQCVEGLAKGPSCFEVPIGGKVSELVQVSEVSDPEKSRLLAGWGKILQPEYIPQDPKKITWRKLLLTQVAWQPARPGAKTWGPPREDWTCAKWTVDGRPVVVINHNITIKLTGTDRIPYRPPTLEEVGTMVTTYVIETQMDKPALLNLLLCVFRVPWQGDSEFVVVWPLGTPGPHSLRLFSEKFHKEPDPAEAHREWYDEMIFEIEGDDPQFLTFGLWKFPA